MPQRRGYRRTIFLTLLVSGLAAGCGRPAPRFSVENARAHVTMLAGTIGSRASWHP